MLRGLFVEIEENTIRNIVTNIIKEYANTDSDAAAIIRNTPGVFDDINAAIDSA